jgi:dienelactone hydrolase
VGDGPWPGVVVVHEAFGLTDDTREQADRLAAPFAVLERVAGFSYHHPSAEDAWARILRFFDTHLR